MKFPDKKYKVIYADPPWYFKSYSEKGENRNPNQHYNCMDLDAIKALSVKNIADKDCVLLMWVIDPMLTQALEVIESWGFKYKTVGFTWAKTNQDGLNFFMGTGYWTRANPEMCLLATRGKPKRINANVRQLVIDKRREHSRKPDQMYSHIENLVEGPYIELFARTTREGWDCWGNETEKFK